MKDFYLFICVLSVALLTRVLFLSYVPQVVFDEVHFGKFISSYCCTHERFFDIHPPVGKLIIALGASMSGYAGEFSFESIGQQYGEVPIAFIRLLPALAGSLLACIVVILLRQTGVSLLIALLGGIAVALDNVLIVESRFIITDSILLSATFGALACAFASIRATSSLRSWVWAIAAGVASGIAVGTKFTGLVAAGLVFVLFAVEAIGKLLPSPKLGEGGGEGRSSQLISPHPNLLPEQEKGVLLHGFLKILVFTLSACIVYLGGWMLHFALLTQPGSGDVWGIPTGVFWQDIVTTHKQMVSANYHLAAAHPYGSSWWTWPLMIRSVFYWQGQENQFIYLLGNPIVWWGSFLFFASAVGTMFYYVVTRSWKHIRSLYVSGAWVFLVGYAVSFVPLMRVPRVLFLYHYLTPLLFSLLFALWWVDKVVGKKKHAFFGVAITLIFVGFVFISPVTYGVTLSDMWYKLLFTFTSWR